MREVGGKSVETHLRRPLPYVAPVTALAPHMGSAEITAPPVGRDDVAALQAASEVQARLLSDRRNTYPHYNTPGQSDITAPVSDVDTAEAIRGTGFTEMFNRPYHQLAPPVAEKPTHTPPVAITHYRHHDVITNNRHPDQALAAQAAGVVVNGLPESWVRMRTGDLVKHYYTDSLTAPTLFAKIRDNASTATQAIEQELITAPAVREVVQKDTVQNIVHSLGYTGLSFIEPLTAISDTTTGRSTVIYPYQSGVGTSMIAEHDHPFHAEQENLKTLSYCIKNLLLQRGIVSYNINSDQYIIDQTNAGFRLYLIEAESYSQQSAGNAAA